MFKDSQMNNLINSSDIESKYINIDDSKKEEKKYSIEEFAYFFNMFQQMNNTSQESTKPHKKKKENVEGDEELPKLKEGTIRKRPDGRYEARYYDEGKRKSVLSRSVKKCKVKLEKAIKQRDQRNKNRTIQEKYTLNEWFNKWISLYKKPYIKEQSVCSITSRYGKYVKNSLGKRNIKSIAALEWQQLFNGIDAPVSAKRLARNMKACYKKAIINKVVVDNPIEGLELTKKHLKKEKFIPTDAQLIDFLEYLKEARNELRLICEFLALTGVRIGEACGLTHDDVDRKNMVIHINKSYSRYTKKNSDPKTQNSIRKIPISDSILKIIDEYTKLYGKKKQVFHMIKSENITNSVKYHAKKNGLNELSPHSFRHYYISKCNEANINPKVITKLTGHKSYELTFDTYTHVSDEFLKKQSKELMNYLKSKKICKN